MIRAKDAWRGMGAFSAFACAMLLSSSPISSRLSIMEVSVALDSTCAKRCPAGRTTCRATLCADVTALSVGRTDGACPPPTPLPSPPRGLAPSSLPLLWAAPPPTDGPPSNGANRPPNIAAPRAPVLLSLPKRRDIRSVMRSPAAASSTGARS